MHPSINISISCLTTSERKAATEEEKSSVAIPVVGSVVGVVGLTAVVGVIAAVLKRFRFGE